VPAGPKERENLSLVSASNFVNPPVTINYVAARLYKKVTGPSDVERPSQCTIYNFLPPKTDKSCPNT